jgi:hypothetical protein
MSQRRYPVSARNWFTLDTVELLFNADTAIYNGSRGIYAPAEYSFHCQNVNNFRNALLVPRTPNATQWRILFTDFQVLMQCSRGFIEQKVFSLYSLIPCYSFGLFPPFPI